MNIWKFLIIGSTLPILLVGCAYSNDRAAPENQAVEMPSKIDLASPTGLEMSQDGLINAANRSSGSVEVYSLDGDVLASPSLQQLNPANQSRDSVVRDVSRVDAVPLSGPDSAVQRAPSSFSRDPSVEVFPLDGGMQGMIAPSMLPGDFRPEVDPNNRGRFAASGAGPAGGWQQFAANTRGFSDVPGGDVIYFRHDSARLSPADKRMIEEVAARAGQSVPVTVEGYASKKAAVADPVQRKIINLQVSMDRAFSVARALMEHGVPAENIIVKAYGETRSGDADDTSRRVEIVGLSIR